MPKSATRSGTHCGHCRGFSMVELAVSMCVMMILTAIAIPSLMRSFRTYQLNDAAIALVSHVEIREIRSGAPQYTG